MGCLLFFLRLTFPHCEHTNLSPDCNVIWFLQIGHFFPIMKYILFCGVVGLLFKVFVCL